jgi:hypothetical protein
MGFKDTSRIESGTLFNYPESPADRLKCYHLECLNMFAENCDPWHAIQWATAFLDCNLTGGPIPALFDLPDEAAFWASCATPPELEAYLGAILHRLGETTFHSKARKRIFVNLWASFSSREQAGFLQKYARETTHELA